MMDVIVKGGSNTARLDSRDAMIRSAAELFREHGYSGTGFRDVIAHSGAPRGSIYHHFPGGKAQLAEETVRYASDAVTGGLERAMARGDVRSALRSHLDWWRRALERSDFQAGCTVAAVAVEVHETPGPAAAADAALG